MDRSDDPSYVLAKAFLKTWKARPAHLRASEAFIKALDEFIAAERGDRGANGAQVSSVPVPVLPVR